MKQITEDQRQKLISLAKIEISRWKVPSDKQYMVDLMEIALASLTADPVAEIRCMEDQNLVVENVVDGFTLGRHVVYTAPPVPMIRLPEESNLSERDAYYAGKNDGWNECLYEIKHLNGWRSHD